MLLIAQAGALFASLFPSPTGTNALEDYVRAADALDVTAFRPYVQTVFRANPQGPPFVHAEIPARRLPPTATAEERREARRADLADARAAQGHWADHLAYCTEVSERFGSVLDFVRSGNTKPTGPALNLRPAASGLTGVVNVALAVAECRFSQGRSAEATAILVDEIPFLQRLDEATIFPMVAARPAEDGRSAILAEFGRHLDALSIADLATVRAAAERALAAPPAQRQQSALRRPTWERNLRQDFDYIIGPLYDPKQPNATPLSPELISRLGALSPDEQRHALDDALARAITAVADVDRTLSGPEAAWEIPKRVGNDLTRKWDDLGAYFADRARSDAFVGLSEEAAYRTRLRLLLLDVRLRSYWFHEGRYPKSLMELGKDVDGTGYAYHADERGFELWRTTPDAPIYLDSRRRAPGAPNSSATPPRNVP